MISAALHPSIPNICRRVQTTPSGKGASCGYGGGRPQATPCSLNQDSMSRPAFLGCRLVIAGAVVGVEAVLGIREDDDVALGVAGRLQLGRHLSRDFPG